MADRDRRFQRALAISLIFHGALLLSLQPVWLADAAGEDARKYHRSYPALAVTMTPAQVSVPAFASAPASPPAASASAEKVSESKLSPVTPEVSMDPGGTGTPPSGVPSEGGKKLQPGEKGGADKKSETPVKSEKTGLSEKNEVPMELSDTRAGAPAAEAAGSGTGDSSDGVNQSLKVTRQGSSPSAMHPALSPQKEDLALRREIESQLRRYIEKYKRYPDAARRRGLAGEVELRLTIKTGSRVELSGARLVRSAGSLLLDREARSLVESFFPYHSDIRGVDAVPGSVLTTSVRIRYEFR